jgi:GNAT superfamily N-acetyltransferase
MSAPAPEQPSSPGPRIVVRAADRPGDLGWVVKAHGEVYAEQFGWDTDFEALVARIVADHAAGHDPAREAAWIAEVDGERAGCIFLVAGEAPGEARLRILLVTPRARGLGLGSTLVEHCLDFARDAGYERVTLWTNDVLVSARRIYRAAGFVLTDEAPHHSFGHDLVGQTWALDLRAGPRH